MARSIYSLDSRDGQLFGYNTEPHVKIGLLIHLETINILINPKLAYIAVNHTVG